MGEPGSWQVAAFLVIAAVASCVVESLAMLFVFMALRRMSGGYHAETPSRCFLVSISVFCMGLLAANAMKDPLVWDVAILAATLELFLEGPLVSARRPLEQEEAHINQAKLKRQSLVIVVGYGALRLAGTNTSRYYAAGAVLASGLHVVGLIAAKARSRENAEMAMSG